MQTHLSNYLKDKSDESVHSASFAGPVARRTRDTLRTTFTTLNANATTPTAEYTTAIACNANDQPVVKNLSLLTNYDWINNVVETATLEQHEDADTGIQSLGVAGRRRTRFDFATAPNTLDDLKSRSCSAKC